MIISRALKRVKHLEKMNRGFNILKDKAKTISFYEAKCVDAGKILKGILNKCVSMWRIGWHWFKINLNGEHSYNRLTQITGCIYHDQLAKALTVFMKFIPLRSETLSVIGIGTVNYELYPCDKSTLWQSDTYLPK